MRLTGFMLLAAAGMAGGCDDPPATGPTPAPSQIAAPAPAASPDRPAAAADRFASKYTRFALERCTVTSRATEGEYIEYRCPGLGDDLLFATLGDGRMDLDAGIKNDSFAGLSAFNDIGAQVEWRLHDGAPVAIIFRYRDATPEGRAAGRSVLAVEKVGRPGAPGCRVAQLAGSTEEVNLRARELADQAAPAFRCGRDEVTYVGNAR